MPGFLLHQGASVICAHGGQATPTAPQPRVQVSNQPITTMSAPYQVAGCPTSPPGPITCVTAQWTTAALRVATGGIPVLLFDSQAITNSPAPLQVLTTQVRVKGA